MTAPVTAAFPLLDTLHQRLSNAPTPLTLKDATKGLVKAGKKAPPPPDFATVLAREIEAGRVFKCASGSKGMDRYWVKDEQRVVREAVLAAAAEPKKLADLKKVAKDAVKADKKFADAIVDGLVATGQLHKQSEASNALYGKHRPPERNDPVKVRAALLAAAATPQTLTSLIAAVVKETTADKQFVASTADELVAGQQLHKHPPASGKKPYYGKDKPPRAHPLDVDPGKKAFAGLVKAAKKVLDAAGVPVDDVFQRLRVALGAEPGLQQVAPPTATVPPVSQPTPPALTPDVIRIGLKAAYDELCLYREFQDKVVEIRRLFHESVRKLPGLTIDQFHRELLHLEDQRTLELHGLNEVQKAKEPELAIRRNDRLLYYVMWGK